MKNVVQETLAIAAESTITSRISALSDSKDHFPLKNGKSVLHIIQQPLSFMLKGI